MSDNLCPYGNSCPQVIAVEGEIKSVSDRIEIQNKFMVEKMNDISSDVKEVKDYLNQGLDKKIDERIEAKWNEKVARLTRWIVTSVVGSSGLTALITLLIK